MIPKTTNDLRRMVELARLAKEKKTRQLPLVDLFEQRMSELIKTPIPQKEYQFHPSRRFRFDYAWPDLMVAVELQGGVYSRGASGHKSTSGLIRDNEKLNSAQTLGWRVFYISRHDLVPELSTSINCLVITLISSQTPPH